MPKKRKIHFDKVCSPLKSCKKCKMEGKNIGGMHQEVTSASRQILLGVWAIEEQVVSNFGLQITTKKKMC